MRVSEAFPSKYLKADDFTHDTVLTIKKIEPESMVGRNGEAEEKYVIYFREVQKGLVINRVNAQTIEGFYGPEMDDWIGRPVTLFSTEVQSFGEQVMAIRVRMRKPQGAAPEPGVAAASELKTAMNVAWTEFQVANSGKTKEEIAPLWRKAIHDYFMGRPYTSLGASEWQAFASEWQAFTRNKFVKPAVPDPIKDEPPVFDDGSGIPF